MRLMVLPRKRLSARKPLPRQPPQSSIPKFIRIKVEPPSRRLNHIHIRVHAYCSLISVTILEWL